MKLKLKNPVVHLMILSATIYVTYASIPLVINTWKFSNATQAAWTSLNNDPDRKNSAKNALVAGCTSCEVQQCDHTVGYGGSPDENGETTLDAMIFDGSTMDMGAIGGLRRIKNVISVARDVLELTEHSILAGDLATDFAKSLGYPEEDLTSNFSRTAWQQWKDAKCQPNYWRNVSPDPKSNCGPYKPDKYGTLANKFQEKRYSSKNHDTIGMIVIDESGNVVAGTSTNGLTHKIAGRVGDSPIPGAGAYADSRFGAAVATGDGDTMMRFLPSFLAVEEMRRGSTSTVAAREAIRRILEWYPSFSGAILATTNKGDFGAACNGMDEFPFSVISEDTEKVIIKTIKCN